MESLESVHVVGRARDLVTSVGTTGSRPRLNLSGRIGLFTAEKRPTQSVRGAAVLGNTSGGEKRGCGQCPYLGLRIGWYIGRTGPDRARFLGSPVFAGAGVRFESHFGNSFPSSEDLLGSDCGQPAQFGGPGAGSSGCFGVFLGAGCRLALAKPGLGVVTTSWGSGVVAA